MASAPKQSLAHCSSGLQSSTSPAIGLPEIGSQGVVSEVLVGKQLNARQIKRVAERFGVLAGCVYLIRSASAITGSGSGVLPTEGNDPRPPGARARRGVTRRRRSEHAGAAAGAAVGSNRQGVPLPDRRGGGIARRSLPGALAAPRLPLHVRARLQGAHHGATQSVSANELVRSANKMLTRVSPPYGPQLDRAPALMPAPAALSSR